MKYQVTRSFVAACAVLAFTSPAVAAENLLQNASFENPTTWCCGPGFEIFEGWLVIGGNTEFTEPAIGAQDGQYSLKLSNLCLKTPQ